MGILSPVIFPVIGPPAFGVLSKPAIDGGAACPAGDSNALQSASIAKLLNDADAQVQNSPATHEYVAPPGGGINGANSLHVVTATGQNTVIGLHTGLSNLTPFGTGPRDNVGLWIYIVDYTEINSMVLHIGPFGLSPNVNKTYDVTGSLDHEFNGWHYFALHRTEADNALWDSDIAHVQITINVIAAKDAEIYLDSVVYSWALSTPEILICFDDVLDSQYDIGKVQLDARGLKGTFWMIGDAVDTVGNMTAAQLKLLNAQCHDIGVHGNLSIDALSQAAAETEILVHRDILDGFNLPRARLHYAYPNGAYDLNAIAALKNLGMLSGRLNPHPRRYRQPEKGQIPDNIYAIGSIGWFSGQSAATINGRVDDVISMGTSAFLNFHGIVDSAPSGDEILTSVYTAILDHIKTKVDAGLLKAVTVTQWYAAFGS